MNLEPIKDLIEADGVAVFGENLFISKLPSSIERGVLLRESYAGTKINYYLPKYYRTEFTVITRAKTYTEAKTLMEEVTAAITITTETQVSPILIRYCRPQTKPVNFPVSDGDLVEFKVTFDICFNE